MFRLGLAAILVGIVAAPSFAGTRPSLTIVSANPLVVRGAGFKADELVSVRVGAMQEGLSAEAARRSARASKTGMFTVRFAAPMPRCRAFMLRADGARGSRATLFVRLHLACESPDSPSTVR